MIIKAIRHNLMYNIIINIGRVIIMARPPKKYSDLSIQKNGEYDYTVSYKIKNLSNVDAKEVSQVYVRDLFSSVVRPIRELKGFSKDLIKAGEEKVVKVNLDKRSFAYYSTAYDDWTVEKGIFIIEIGTSSRDIKLTGKIEI